MLNQLLLYFTLLFFALNTVFSQTNDSNANHYTQVISPTKTSHLPSGYFYYLRQKESHLKNGDTLQAIDAQRMAAIASFKLGNFNESEQLAVEALGWLGSITITSEEKQSRIAGLYNQLGKIYRNKANYGKALDYYNLAMEHVDNFRDSITAYNNRANVYMELGDYVSAENDFRVAIDLSRKQQDTLRLAQALNNMGVLKLRSNNSEGLVDIEQALEMRRAIGDKEGMYSGYRHLALFALNEKDTVAAKAFATNTLEIAYQLNSPSYLLESLSILMDLKNDTLVSRYKILTDSINRAEQEEQNLYAAMRFDVEKEVRNTRLAELQLEKERSQKSLFLIIGVLLFALAGLVIIIILNRVKRMKQEEVLKTENRISKRVHDELANEVYQVMVKMQVDNHKKDDLLDDLEQLYNKSRDISKEYHVLDTETPFEEILTDLLNSYQSESIKIMVRYTNSVNWANFSQSKKNTLYRVLQELMTNMKKHSRANLVVVSFTQNTDNIEVKYSDNGVGTGLKKQNGLQNAENRIFALNGSITFETKPEQGFKVKITI